MFLGIEIGGTKLQLGLGAGDGTLRGLWRATVDVAAGPEGIRKQIAAGVPELLARAGVERSQVRGVGIGFGGPVDDATHAIIKSHQIEGWDGFPLADWLTELLGWPAVLGNDADCAGLAEALFGAGKGLSPIFYITIGSGIGGGLIVNGEIYRGCGRGAAEIGHLRVGIPDLQTTADAEHYGPLESIASGWGMERLLRTFAKRNPQNASGLLCATRGRGTDPAVPHLAERITVRDLAEAMASGNRDALGLFKIPLTCLAEAICHVIALLSPRRIIIGGGVSLMGEELLFKPLRERVAERVFQPFAECYDIVPAALGEEVVVHGALALARRHSSPGGATA